MGKNRFERLLEIPEEKRLSCQEVLDIWNRNNPEEIIEIVGGATFRCGLEVFGTYVPKTEDGERPVNFTIRNLARWQYSALMNLNRVGGNN